MEEAEAGRKVEQSVCCEGLSPKELSGSDTVSSGSSWSCVTRATLLGIFLVGKEGGAQRRSLWSWDEAGDDG